MWGKLKRRVSRSKYESYTATEDASGEIIMKNFRKIPSSYTGFDATDSTVTLTELSTTASCAIDARDDTKDTNSQSCKCSPLLNFPKHLFGSLRQHKRTETGQLSQDVAVTKISPHGALRETTNLDVSCDNLTSNELQPKLLQLDCESYNDLSSTEQKNDSSIECLKLSSGNPSALHSESNDRISAMMSWSTFSNDHARKASPPKLKRREKLKTGEIIESRKSRLSGISVVDRGRECINPSSGAPHNISCSGNGYDETDACQINLLSDNQLEVVLSSSAKQQAPVSLRRLRMPSTAHEDLPDSAKEGGDVNSEDREQWSSPDYEEDPEEKESGYTTLEEVAAHSDRNRSSCSSEDRENEFGSTALVQASRNLHAADAMRRRCGNSMHSSHASSVLSAYSASLQSDRRTRNLSSEETPADLQTSSTIAILHRSAETVNNRSNEHVGLMALQVQDSSGTVSSVGPEHVEYIPADSSAMSMIYQDLPSSSTANIGFDGIVRSVRELYASVPKSPSSAVRSDDENIATAVNSCECTPRRQLLLYSIAPSPRRTMVVGIQDDSRLLFQSGGLCIEQRPTSFRSEYGVEEAEEDEDEEGEVDEVESYNINQFEDDDGEYMPPLPSRNYDCNTMTTDKRWHSGNIGGEVIRDSADFDESSMTHMSWEEVMNQARLLGIPLANGARYSQSDRSAASSNTSSIHDVCLPLNHSSDVKSTANRVTTSARHSRESLNYADQKKSLSPFRDRFHLPNLFSKNWNKTPTRNGVGRCLETSGFSSMSSGSDIQKRSLPVPPKPPRHSSSRCSDVIDEVEPIPSPPPRGASRRAASSLSIPCHGVSGSEPCASSESWGSCQSVPMQPGCMSASESSGSVGSVFSRSYHGGYAMPPSLAEGMCCGGGPPYSAPVAHPNVQESLFRGVEHGTLGGYSSTSGVSHLRDAGRVEAHGCGPVADVVHVNEPMLTSSSSTGHNNSDFIQSFSKLKECGWYWGPLGWYNAESKLANTADGSFLVRDSSDDRYILSLSFRSQGMTHHTRIEHYKGMFSFYSQPKSHGASTIVEFIERAMEYSRSGKFLYFLRPRAPGLPPAPVQLLHPISRLRNMHSLQHLCRFVTVRHVRRDLIDRLPIPPRLKEYLKETQYYTETDDACTGDWDHGSSSDAGGGHQYFTQEW